MSGHDTDKALAAGADTPVLVVDDDPVTSRLIRGVLESRGIGPVTTVGTLGEAGRAVAEIAFSAVIADLHLPDGNGMELVHLIRRGRHTRCAGCTIVVSSAYRNETVTRLLARLGADTFLGKPADPEALLAAIAWRKDAA